MSDNDNLVFGVYPALEKLRAYAKDIVEILIVEGVDRGPIRQIEREAKRHGLGVTRVPSRLLDRLAHGQRHQGVVVRVEAYRYLPFDALLQQLSAPPASSSILLLDGLTDPRNFGALLRTSEAVGISYVIIPKDRAVDVTPVVIKASAGAAHYLKISKVTNLRRTIGALKERGFWAVGLDSRSPETIYDKDFPDRLAIILGSEGTGVRPVNLKECDFVVSIPMAGRIASLNVATAGAVFLYELARRKQLSKRNGVPTRG
jgi:23S rRNA (guanosine2251-2'-O)-methyltransferase